MNYTITKTDLQLNLTHEILKERIVGTFLTAKHMGSFLPVVLCLFTED